MVSGDSLSARACASEICKKRSRCPASRCASKEASVTGSEHMLHVGGKASALISFSFEEQKEVEQSPQRWCGNSEVQRTPEWSWERTSEQTQHSTGAIAVSVALGAPERARRANEASLNRGKAADLIRASLFIRTLTMVTNSTAFRFARVALRLLQRGRRLLLLLARLALEELHLSRTLLRWRRLQQTRVRVRVRLVRVTVRVRVMI